MKALYYVSLKLNENDYTDAAIKIQSTFRGHVVRRNSRNTSTGININDSEHDTDIKDTNSYDHNVPLSIKYLILTII